MKKNEQIEAIFELIDTEHSIQCSNCRKIEYKYNCNESDASEMFYNSGWRVKTGTYCYCPNCAEANSV